MSVLAEIAIQMKGSLSFLLGLGAMFSMSKAGFTALFGLPELSAKERDTRASLARAVDRMRRNLWITAAAMCVLFFAACWLYFGPLGDVDANKLSGGAVPLTSRQEYGVVGLVIIAVIFVALDVASTVSRQQMMDLIRRERDTK